MAATGQAAGAASFRKLATLRSQFPGWRIWLSDRDRLWATRSPARRPAHPPADWAMTVDADTPDQMREALDRQAQYTPG